MNMMTEFAVNRTGERRKLSLRKIPVLFSCDVNRTCFSINGQIEIASGLGFCSAGVAFDRNHLPDGFAPELLSYVIITGYPDACLSIGNAHNPFTKRNTNFIATRKIDLGDVGTLQTVYFSENRGADNEKMTFNVSGEVNLTDQITSIAPINEIWTPSLENEFSGEMTFTWKLKSGKTLTGHASGKYNIDGAELKTPQMRVITFDLEIGDSYFKQEETIRLYDLREWQSGTHVA